MRLLLLLAFSFGLRCTSFAQAIDNVHRLNGVPGINLTYENDFVNNTDEYYTQGICLDLVHPSLKLAPVNRVLLLPHGKRTSYGLAIEQDVYTPTSITDSSIRYGDRPFAAALIAKYSCSSYDSQRHYMLVSSVVLGIIGPAAGGGEMQTFIHRHTANALPLGWRHQIANDLILNYEVAAEKEVLRPGQIIRLDLTTTVRAGTLSTKANAGLCLSIGSPDRNSSPKKPFSLRLYSQPQISIVGYDATLQGGLFNRKSSYTIVADDMSRIVFSDRTALNINYKRLLLECSWSYISKEFSGGHDHAWGGLGLGYEL